MSNNKALTPYTNSNLPELSNWGKFAIKAGLLPQGTNAFQAMAIIQTGHEIGLAPLQSLRSMSFIRGRLVMSVQLQLALAKNRGVFLEKLVESEGKCTITLKRNGENITCTYTREDAQKAKLIYKDGSWDKYEKQMLRWRAVGDGLRLIAPDLVMGLLSPEEAESIEEFKPAGEPIEPIEGGDINKNTSWIEKLDKPESTPGNVPELITLKQRLRFFALGKKHKYTNGELKTHLKLKYKTDSSNDIKREWYEQICEEIENEAIPREGEDSG